MTRDHEQFLQRFFAAVKDRPLDGKQDPFYVPLYEDPLLAPHDPVKLLARAIEWTPGKSAQLFSGFRGSGKSTELRRLQRHLTDKGYKVVLCDVESYLDLAEEIGITEFLIAVAGAFGEGLERAGYLPKDPKHEDYWTRIAGFFQRTRLEVPEINVGAELGGKAKLNDDNEAAAKVSVGMKAALKTDSSFRKKLRDWAQSHLGTLVRELGVFIEDCVKAVRKHTGDDAAEIVLIVDSMEHIRGTAQNAAQVQSSVAELFSVHADKLDLPYLHVIYTVPPYLKVLYPNISSLYEPGGLRILPTLKVRSREDGKPFQPGLDLLERIIAKRGDWRELLGNQRDALDLLGLKSGGHLRDYLRLFAEVLRRADGTPVTSMIVSAAIQQNASEFLPIADADAAWLARIAGNHEACLPDQTRVPDFARFLDTHLVLCYRNGDDGYDVHPLVADVVKKQAIEVAQRLAVEKKQGGA